MGRPIHLDTADYQAFDVLEYLLAESLDLDIAKYLTDAADSMSADTDSIGGRMTFPPGVDEIVRLPHGSYVRIRWNLEVLDPEEAKLEIEAASG